MVLVIKYSLCYEKKVHHNASFPTPLDSFCKNPCISQKQIGFIPVYCHLFCICELQHSQFLTFKTFSFNLNDRSKPASFSTADC